MGNSDYNANNNPLLSKNLTSLAIFAIWPFQTEEFLNDKRRRRIHYRIGFVVYCLFFIFLITEYIELAHVWGNLEDMTTNMSVSCLYTLGVLKMYAFFGQRQKLKSLIEGISTIERNILSNDNERIKVVLRNYIKRARLVTYFFWALCVSTIAVFFVIPPIEYTFNSAYHKIYDNGTEYWSYVKPMIFSSWFPFDKYSKINYAIAYVYQMMMGTVGAGYQGIWDMMIVTMMIHSIGQLQILQKTMGETTRDNIRMDANSQWKNVKTAMIQKKSGLKEVVNSDITFDEIKHRRLVDCVAHHRYILKYTQELNTILRPVMMLYFLVCSLMLCAIGFQASLYGLSVRLWFMLEYLVAIMIQLFLFYWHGNEVLHESNQLLLSTYKCKWYNQCKRFNQSLWILREGIKLPIRYTVGPFYTMSLPTFLAILKASYSYFTLLRQFQESTSK